MHIRSVRFTERNGGLHPAAHFCVKEICIFSNNVVSIKYRNDSIITIYKFIHHYVLTQYFFHTATTFPPIFALSIKYLPKKPHPYLRRYTFLSHLTMKSKISVRCIKKMVAATSCVCNIIQSQSFIAYIIYFTLTITLFEWIF